MHQTKKMAKTLQEIDRLFNERQRLISLRQNVTEFDAQTELGKKASDEARQRLLDEAMSLSNTLQSLRERLDLETIAMLSGEDTEMAEPTPAV